MRESRGKNLSRLFTCERMCIYGILGTQTLSHVHLAQNLTKTKIRKFVRKTVDRNEFLE